MKSLYTLLVFSFLVLSASLPLNAEILKTESGEITKLYSYDDYGNGDVYIPFLTGLNACPNGVYLSPQSPGFKTMVSFILTAYTANKKVQFQVYSDQIWNGSVTLNCKVDTVILK